MKNLAKPGPSTRLSFRRTGLVFHLARWLLLLSLGGCAVFQPGDPGPVIVATQAPATQAPTIQEPAILEPSPTFTLTPLPLPSQTPAPLPTATLEPTLAPSATTAPSPLPTLTPFATLAPPPTFDIAKYTPSATATIVYAQVGHCCTLRVRNGGSISLWIGKKLPRNGSVIKPRWYVEFYLPQPQTVTVYWCLWVDRTKVPDDDLLGAPARGSDNLFDCRHREIYVGPGETEMYVTQ